MYILNFVIILRNEKGQNHCMRKKYKFLILSTGITGRLNGAGAEAFWGQSAPHTGAQQMHHHSKMPVGPGNGAGWEEPSPPSQRRNMPNYDDGTSLWGNPQQGRTLIYNLFFYLW